MLKTFEKKQVAVQMVFLKKLIQFFLKKMPQPRTEIEENSKSSDFKRFSAVFVTFSMNLPA